VHHGTDLKWWTRPHKTVGGGFLYIPERDAGVEGGGDEAVAEAVG
jgi:hypothetical protein